MSQARARFLGIRNPEEQFGAHNKEHTHGHCEACTKEMCNFHMSTSYAKKSAWVPSKCAPFRRMQSKNALSSAQGLCTWSMPSMHRVACASQMSASYA